MGRERRTQGYQWCVWCWQWQPCYPCGFATASPSTAFGPEAVREAAMPFSRTLPQTFSQTSLDLYGSKAQTPCSFFLFFFSPKEALPTCFLSKEIQSLTTDPAVSCVLLYSVYSTPPPQECCFYWALPCRVLAQTLLIRLCDN